RHGGDTDSALLGFESFFGSFPLLLRETPVMAVHGPPRQHPTREMGSRGVDLLTAVDKNQNLVNVPKVTNSKRGRLRAFVVVSGGNNDVRLQIPLAGNADHLPIP